MVPRLVGLVFLPIIPNCAGRSLQFKNDSRAPHTHQSGGKLASYPICRFFFFQPIEKDAALSNGCPHAFPRIKTANFFKYSPL
jgi:hypothetical protein